MQRLAGLTVSVLVSAAIPAQVLAVNTWCYDNHSDAIFCEDFDRYCVDPPPAPGRCEPQGVDIRNTWAMWDVWDGWHNCGWVPAVNDEGYSSYPYSAKIGCQGWNNELGYGNTALGDDIKLKFGSAYSEVLATDLTPLTVEFALNGGTKMHSANLYLELGRGRATPLVAGTDSLTNWIISPNCRSCGNSGDQDYYPIICRQSPKPTGCADASTAPVLPVIAAGFLAFLDQDPCNCGGGNDHWPQVDHLAFFDGHVWYTLRKGLFPDPGGSEPAPGDFSLVAATIHNRVRLTIKRTTVTVELRVGNPVVLSRCEIPRAYLGSFNTMLMGYQTPCQLVQGTWNCNGALDCNGPCGPVKTCCVSGTAGGGTVAIDDIVLSGGGYGEQGACCFPDTTCTECSPSDCAFLGGQPAAPGSTCANTACCPPLRADHNMDGDVDLDDFGWFQTCLSGVYVAPPTVACRCADLDHDDDVDADDLAAFLRCATGPGIPADPNCAD